MYRKKTKRSHRTAAVLAAAVIMFGGGSGFTQVYPSNMISAHAISTSSSVAEFQQYCLENWTAPIIDNYTEPSKAAGSAFGCNRDGRTHAAINSHSSVVKFVYCGHSTVCHSVYFGTFSTHIINSGVGSVTTAAAECRTIIFSYLPKTSSYRSSPVCETISLKIF